MAFATRPKAVRSQLPDLAAEEIRRLIVSGEAPAGTPLRLEALAAHLEMSNTPIREALFGLAQEGWVVQEPNRGFRVTSFRHRDIADLYELHAYLFGELARRAARYITPQMLADLRAIDAELRATPVSD